MKKRTVFTAVAMLCLLMIFSACAGSEPQSSVLSGKNLSSRIPKIVFCDTIDDPEAEHLNTLGSSKTTGTVKLELTLNETKPNVFEGYGIMTRNLNVQDSESSSNQKYIYRTGLIQAAPDKEGMITLTGSITEDRSTETMLLDAPFRLDINKDGTLQQKTSFVLKLDGENASLTIKLHDYANFVFNGKLTKDTSEPSAGKSLEPGSLIYINSLWPKSLSGGGEYTAILLASHDVGKNSYSGQLSISGNGNDLNNISEKVTFSIGAFDSTEYRKLGGKLSDKFAQMAALHTSGGDYILLLDGEQLVLEPIGKNIYFCGSLHSNSEDAALQNEADKTKKMLSYLYRQKYGASSYDYSEFKGLNPNDPEDMKKLMNLSEDFKDMVSSDKNAPAWYPDDLIPSVNFSTDDGYNTIQPSDELLFKIYNTQYCENEDFKDLVEPYRAALSCYDDYKEFVDYQKNEGVFLFAMGKYRIQVFLAQSNLKISNVSVQIY
ncbi:MAG: hypothetical protein Q8865_09005 [Bacillota bacterium]|nr:hypothetical protein [Bacillota bacterium]